MVILERPSLFAPYIYPMAPSVAINIRVMENLGTTTFHLHSPIVLPIKLGVFEGPLSIANCFQKEVMNLILIEPCLASASLVLVA